MYNGGNVLIQRRTKIHGQSWSAWSQIDQIAGSSSQYNDLSLYCEGSGADSAQYKIQSVDAQSHASAFSQIVTVKFDNNIRKEATSGPLSSMPLAFRVRECYPNPFNPTTTINFELPIDANVSMAVYDLLGKQVGLLVSGIQGAGYHSVVWDASSVSSGVYYLRMVATDVLGNVQYTKVSKLVLMK